MIVIVKNSVALVCEELYRPSDRHLSAMLVRILRIEWCHVVNAVDPYDRILGFLDRNRWTATVWAM
jgi:hypothetical protein